MNSTVVIMFLVFATAFYRIGNNEYKRGFLFAGISLLLSVVGFFSPWGVLASIFAQMGILIAMTLINLIRKPRE
ncbi:MAG: hypothetical protein K8S62_08900 [Candidatus Sabulitectum sp.]|nr:hypothetical protein [Candidatus Sabulitectum sp.]